VTVKFNPSRNKWLTRKTLHCVVLEHLDGVLWLPLTVLCLSSGMRLNGRHGTSGATETISESRDEFASSSGVGECIWVLFMALYLETFGSACYVFKNFTKTGIVVRKASGLILRCCVQQVDRTVRMVYWLLATLSTIQTSLACMNTNMKVPLRLGK